VKDFKLKLILSALSAIVFSFIFILLAFALPIKKDTMHKPLKQSGGKLEQISHAIKNR